MAVPNALHLALDLARNPVLAQVMRQQPVPKDVLTLIRIAARDPEATEQAAKATKKNAEVLRTAAVLYLQQVLWGPGASHYRALGVKPSAGKSLMLEHLRWLMKWLHPDQPHVPQEEAFAERVIAAWNAVKTPERRKLYDRTLNLAPAKAPQQPRSARRVPWISDTGQGPPEERIHLWWRIAATVVAAIGLVAIVTTDWSPLIAPRQAAVGGFRAKVDDRQLPQASAVGVAKPDSGLTEVIGAAPPAAN